MSRKEIRHELATLIAVGVDDLVSRKPGTEEPAVYRGQVGDFKKARAVVVVSSAGTSAYPLAVKTLIGKHDISVDIFVLYADEEAGWDEEDAEDLLDDISDRILTIVEQNPTGKNWNTLDWNEPSQPTPIDVGGTDYRREQIILKPS
jgi:hypothetical protein